MKRLLALVAVAAALVTASGAAAFDNTEPFASQQWYLTRDLAWDFWETPPDLARVKVAIIDSGIDGEHPDLVGRVVAARSFVGGSPYHDEQGHGTFIAGEIAANPSNATGIAGIAFNARLIIGKVVEPDGTVSLPAEVAAIRWAVHEGAQVINLSLGGVRDPLDARLDTYSALEQAAVEYAYSKGVVVVAAVGNGPQSPATPWNFAHYPSALPHVIGVSALQKDGSVPDYSNRDAVFNDISAPGDGIFSTIPRDLADSTTACPDGPYSICGPDEFRDAIGTSFAAPQVTAAAALLLGQDPRLTPDQVSWLLERGADDVSPATGCAECPVGRDKYSGWGSLDVLSSLTMLTNGTPLPPPDRYEPNDEAGAWAHALPPLPRTIDASLDFWDDNVDVYHVYLRRGQRLYARLTPSVRAGIRLAVWSPGTKRVEGLQVDVSRRVAQSRSVGAQARIAYRAPVSGTYFVQAKLVSRSQNPVQYRLSLVRRAS
ncbi:MAG TPA: S8 family serine peptidase [Gaiellaceae bacterium]|nr:S8 family serine peptidase [Gaiellaceae bacterium]